MSPMRIGIPYEMYRPMVAMDVAAAKATEEPREGRPRQKAQKAASQMVRTGARKRASTLWKKCGCLGGRVSRQYIYMRGGERGGGDRV
jgi:hypothetical protein